MEKAREFQKNIYFCFTDYTKVFDCVDHSKLWKTLKETGIPVHLTCLLGNLYVDQEATVRTDMEQRTGSKLGKEYDKAVYCHPVCLTYMQSTLCKMPGWMNHKLESRLPGKILISNHIDFRMKITRGFPGSSEAKNPPANAGDVGSISGSGRHHGESNGNPL